MPGPSLVCLVCLASHGGPEGMPRRTQEPCSLRPGHQPVFIPLLWGNRFCTPQLTEVKYRISNLPLFILGLLEKLNLQLIPISGYDAFQPSPNALHLNSVKPPSVSPQRETDSGRGSIDMERRWSSVQNPAQLQLHRAGFWTKDHRLVMVIEPHPESASLWGLTLGGLTEFRCNAF